MPGWWSSCVVWRGVGTSQDGSVPLAHSSPGRFRLGRFTPQPAVPATQSGVHVAGTELEGLHREVLVRAVRHLEQQGKAKLFKGALGDDEGVKFFTQG